MLKSRNLDDQSFLDIVDHAIGRLPQLCRAWTNHNPSDPGITLIELLAWYKEMQQYQMNFYTGEMQTKLLKLLGVTPRPPREALCGIELPEDSAGYPAYSRLRTAEGLTFELLEDIPAERARLAACYHRIGRRQRDVSPILQRGDMPLQVFRVGSGEDAELTLAFSALPKEKLRLWFEVGEMGEPLRNPFRPGQRLPRRLRWQPEGCGPVEPLEDETCALSQSGYVTLPIPEGWQPGAAPAGGPPCWLLHITLDEPGCEESVQLLSIRVSRFRAAQKETWSESRYSRVEQDAACTLLYTDALARDASFTLFIRETDGWRQSEAREVGTETARGLCFDSSRAVQDGEDNCCVVCADPIHYTDLFLDSDGLPGQSFRLELGGRQILTDRFTLFCDTYTEDGTIRPMVWECRDDLTACGPRDRVFAFDPVHSRITFGDGEHGAVVPRGKTAILAANLILTSAGGGSLPRSESLRLGDGTVVRNFHERDGQERETVDQAAARLLRRLSQPRKCVTAEDYEVTACRTPGLRVAAARALPGYDPAEPTGSSRNPVVTMVVIPGSDQDCPMPNESFLQAVQEYMEERRPIGVKVRVIPPRYAALAVSVNLHTNGSVNAAEVEETLDQCIRLEPGRRGIGEPVLQSELMARLQRLPGVLAVTQLSMQSMDGLAAVTGTGDVQLPGDAVPRLAGCSVTFR